MTFNFGGIPIIPGSTVTFAQTFSGPGSLFFDTGAVSGPAGVTETNATTPPLDVFRRASVGITVTQATTALPTPLPPSWILTLTAMALIGAYYALRGWKSRTA